VPSKQWIGCEHKCQNKGTYIWALVYSIVRVTYLVVRCKHKCCKESKHQLAVELTCMHRNGEVEKHSIALEAATDITKEYTAEISGKHYFQHCFILTTRNCRGERFEN
jgi:hypothetical protein